VTTPLYNTAGLNPCGRGVVPTCVWERRGTGQQEETALQWHRNQLRSKLKGSNEFKPV
jgi:hypothetical protein